MTNCVTRDRLYGEVSHQDRRFLLIDTGGLSDDGDVLCRGAGTGVPGAVRGRRGRVSA